MNSEDITCRQRRGFLASMAGVATTALLVPSVRVRADELAIEVWTNPSCGCCKDWIVYLEEHGFTVTTYNEGSLEAMERLGIPPRYGSCHTAEIQGYAVEGHVPVREILRLIDERPDAIGISVPAMPRGSPGMDGPQYGNVVDPYDVILIGRDGQGKVFKSYR